MAIGLGDQTAGDGTVSGTNSLGIFMGDQTGIDLASANTMALLGGDFIVGSYQLDDTTTGNQDNRMFYDTSKGALVMMTRTLAQALAPHDIRVNGIAPGVVPTEIMMTALDLDEESVQGLARRVPLRRLGAPQDMGAIALFLASDAGSWITGSTLAASGGQ